MPAKNDPAPAPAPEAAPVVAAAPARRGPLATTLLPLALVLVLSPGRHLGGRDVRALSPARQGGSPLRQARRSRPSRRCTHRRDGPVPVIKGGKDGDKKAVAPNAYEFTNVVVNLAGVHGHAFT